MVEGAMRAVLPWMCACSAFIAVTASAQRAAAPGQYTNVRFGYSICLPPGLMADRPPDNGDGQSFHSRDGASILLWGSYDTNSEGPKGELAYFRHDVLSAHGVITYEAGGGTWQAASGKRGESILYQKSLKRDDRLASLRITYPQKVSSRWNGLVANMVRCFRMDTAAF